MVTYLHLYRADLFWQKDPFVALGINLQVHIIDGMTFGDLTASSLYDSCRIRSRFIPLWLRRRIFIETHDVPSVGTHYDRKLHISKAEDRFGCPCVHVKEGDRSSWIQLDHGFIVNLIAFIIRKPIWAD